MKTVRLYGELGKRFGREHQFDAANLAQCIRALSVNIPGFEAYMMNAHLESVGFKVFIGRHTLPDAKSSTLPSSDREIIRIVPRVLGAGNGVFQVVLGAALIAAGAFIPGLGVVGTSLIFAGAAQVLGGVSSLLTRVPTIPATATEPDAVKRPSYVFAGPTNVSEQGRAIPIVYGRMFVGSNAVSAGISVTGFEQATLVRLPGRITR